MSLLPKENLKELNERFEIIEILTHELIPITEQILLEYVAINAPLTINRVSTIFFFFFNLSNMLFVHSQVYKNYIPFLFDNLLMTYTLGKKYKELVENEQIDITKPIDDIKSIQIEFSALEINLIQRAQSIINTILHFKPIYISTNDKKIYSLQNDALFEENIRKSKHKKFTKLVIKLMTEKLSHLERRKELSMLENYILLMGCILGFLNQNIDTIKFYMEGLLEQYEIYKGIYNKQNTIKH